MIRYCHISSPIGTLTAVSEDGFLTELHLSARVIPGGIYCKDAVLGKTEAWLNGYFKGDPSQPDVNMKPRGTLFQLSVWKLVALIPRGETVTYGKLAEMLDHPRMSLQAVGQAVGRNPIPILIPCHRVLGAGDKLTGYSGGLDKKRYLLDLEHISYK